MELDLEIAEPPFRPQVGHNRREEIVPEETGLAELVLAGTVLVEIDPVKIDLAEKVRVRRVSLPGSVRV